MTDRDRLILDITKSDKATNEKCKNCTDPKGSSTYCAKCACEQLADNLLADGWIRPPCKVGDKVYKITRNKVKECEVVFIGISADEKCSYFNFVENYADGTFYKSYSMVFDVIGKTVFLTREEAEKALERSKGNA